MKRILFIVGVLFYLTINSQAYTGKGDTKFQIAFNSQDNGTGINGSYDFGVGENISFGISATYLLGVDDSLDADFLDKFDARARFNANIGNVLALDDNFDLYPGLSFGLKNFGGHLGARYFFTTGFGVFTELNTPIAKYNSGTLSPAETLHNQFSFSLGAVFNL